MSLRPFRNINRKQTKVINVGDVKIGGDNPISVQSMTNTLTTDIKSTINQINAIHEEGADIVRVSCPDEKSTKALREITKNVKLPIVADIHFHYIRAVEAAKMGASCLRINPGNIGSNDRVLEVIKAAKDNNCSIRIGVNAGSLDKTLLEKYKEPCPEALVESAMYNVKLLEDNDFFNFKISVKSSDVFLTVKAYKRLSEVCNYPLHLGVTEAGGLLTGALDTATAGASAITILGTPYFLAKAATNPKTINKLIQINKSPPKKALRIGAMLANDVLDEAIAEGMSDENLMQMLKGYDKMSTIE